jgi:hypothetical protein
MPLASRITMFVADAGSGSLKQIYVALVRSAIAVKPSRAG